MKIVITGADGQLGGDCKEVLKRNFEIVPLELNDLDITNMPFADKLIGEIAPQIILNCAAYTNVDDCETKRDLAWKVNVEGPRNLAVVANTLGARLVHISSDYVFDGRKEVPEPYTETDKANPISYYGVTKSESEGAVRGATDNYVILRTAWMYGIQGQNFLRTMLNLALKDPKREIKVVNDQFGSPTWTYRLARQIAGLIESGGQGTYHATSEGYCTWYELATDFLDKMGVPHLFVPCSTEEYPTPAQRPINSILENKCLKESGLNLMKDWKSDLDEYVVRFRERLIKQSKGI